MATNGDALLQRPQFDRIGQMIATAQDALATMGMGNARALFAAHNDEGYAHLHIVASKINPETGALEAIGEDL